MVSSVIDVSGWQMKVQWAARQQSAEEIADLALQSCDRFVRAFPEFEGAWKVSSEVGSVEYRDNAVPELVRSSLLRVDGEPDPARGFSFLLLSPMLDGSYAAIRVRAGATHQTRRVAPNSVSVDFSSVEFGEPVTLSTSGPGFEAFVDLAKSLEVLWEAESMKVDMTGLTEIGCENYSEAIPLLGGFLENLYQYWWDDYSSVADYVDFYIDGFSREELAGMSKEFVSLGADGAEGREVDAFLRRMNANYRPGSGSGRALLREVGKRVEELADGAVPKVFD